MNVIGESQELEWINNILTFTVIKRPPEIFLITFLNKEIKFCDIDEWNMKTIDLKGNTKELEKIDFFPKTVRIL